MWFKNLWNRFTGKTRADAEKQKADELLQLKSQVEGLVRSLTAEAEAKREEIAKLEAEKERAAMSPKETATRKKEPWVAVVNTHIDPKTARNGFFELDWNDQFIVQLKLEGYGTDGDKDEDIVDRWFREMCANVVVSGDYGPSVSAGLLRTELAKDY